MVKQVQHGFRENSGGQKGIAGTSSNRIRSKGLKLDGEANILQGEEELLRINIPGPMGEPLQRVGL